MSDGLFRFPGRTFTHHSAWRIAILRVRFTVLALLAGMALGFPGFARAAATPSAAAANAASLYDQAKSLFRQGSYKRAIALLDELLLEDPHSAKGLVLRGDARDNLGDPQGALIDYNAAIALNPEFEYAYATRCATYGDLGRLKDAIGDCSKALSLDPKDTWALRTRSVAYLLSQRYARALTDIDAALALDDTDASGYIDRCRIYRGMDRLNLALGDCNRAVALDPKSAAASFYRGVVEIRERNWNGASSDFESSLALDATETGAHYWLAYAYHRLGRQHRALGEIAAYVRGVPDDGDGYLLRAKILMRLGRAASAKRDAARALQRYKIADDQSGMARATEFLNEAEKQ